MMKKNGLPFNERYAEMTLKVLLGGDVMFGRYTKHNQYIKYNDFDPLNDLKKLQTDVNIVNLENPLCTPWLKKRNKTGDIYLRGEPNAVHSLLNANINIVSFANNHSGDFDALGIKQTLDILNQNQINYAGVSLSESPLKPFIDHNKKILFFAITTIPSGCPQYIANVLNSKDRKNYLDIIKNYRLLYPNYTIINSIHWGIEYNLAPHFWQSHFAKKLIDSGSDIIMGHGPHVKQRYEIYQNKIILYSLGNLYFNHLKPQNNLNPHTHTGSIALLEIDQNTILNFKEIPYYINETKTFLKFDPTKSLF